MTSGGKITSFCQEHEKEIIMLFEISEARGRNKEGYYIWHSLGIVEADSVAEAAKILGHEPAGHPTQDSDGRWHLTLACDTVGRDSLILDQRLVIRNQEELRFARSRIYARDRQCSVEDTRLLDNPRPLRRILAVGLIIALGLLGVLVSYWIS
ncbi:MAG: hypothetical protein G01um101438_130 [Parcubacteria group bacterium Gr01-1014_38]|nr:MAG: hypothetical protein G01um101438_130 [Parcubacteria group bacterium Gr01-1014_38]